MTGTPDTPPLAVAMTPGETAMFESHLKPGSLYLEFGSGGSTALAIGCGVRQCHSVESDPEWVKKLRLHEAIREAESGGRLVFHLADIGPTMSWGMPANRGRIERWPDYFLPVWSKLGAPPDLVLIDGRFRVACGLVALLACGPETTILMHDFFDKSPIRKAYQGLLRHAEIAEQHGNLVSLRRREGQGAGGLVAALADAWTDFS